MESDINKAIREVLEMFGIPTDRIIGEWNIIGHLVEIFSKLEQENAVLRKEVERLDFLHKNDHSLADQWQAQNEILRAKLERAARTPKDAIDFSAEPEVCEILDRYFEDSKCQTPKE